MNTFSFRRATCPLPRLTAPPWLTTARRGRTVPSIPHPLSQPLGERLRVRESSPSTPVCGAVIPVPECDKRDADQDHRQGDERAARDDLAADHAAQYQGNGRIDEGIAGRQ